LLRFIKEWTLPVSMGIGAVVYLIFYYVEALDGLSQQLAPIFNAILPLFMFLILYVTFCKVDFRKIAVVRWHIWTSAFQMLFVALFMGIILLLKLSGDALILSESVLVCVISCGGNPQARWQS